MLPVDLETATVAQLRHLIDNGQLTAVDLVRACRDRIRAMNSRGPALNSVRALNPDALAEAAEYDGPLRGIPVLVKDNIDVLGMPTTAGSIMLEHALPDSDATLVAQLRRAGAVILGKANLTEFANFLAEGMPGGYSSLGGQVRNPYDAALSPSGSSSGSASAAASGFAPLTVGTETSGSILAPAVVNSVVGIKPTVGLVSRTGVVPIAASQDTPGPMAKTVADAAALLTALTGKDPDDPATHANPLADHDFTGDLRTDALRGARIGVVHDTGVLWDLARATLTAQGAVLVPLDLDTGSSITDDRSSVLNYEFKRDLATYLARLPASPVRTLADVIAWNMAHADEMLKYGQARALASELLDLSPDSADTARYHADRAQDLADSKDRIDALLAAHDLTALLFAGYDGHGIGAKAGYPSITVPAGYQAANRRPFGITFLGPAWTEPRIVGYAYAYEQASRLRRPPSEINPALFRYDAP